MNTEDARHASIFDESSVWCILDTAQALLWDSGSEDARVSIDTIIKSVFDSIESHLSLAIGDIKNEMS